MQLVLVFVLRWIINSFSLYLAMRLVAPTQSLPDILQEPNTFLIAGFALSLMNIFVRPFVAIISLPITILTLGLFTLVVNGLMVYLALQLTPNLTITFGSAILIGIIVGVVNFVTTQTLSTVKAAK